MAKAIETLSIQLKFQDAGSQAVIERLRGSLKKLELGASGAKPRIASLRKEILAQGNASVKSVSNINAQSTALKALRDEAKIGSRAFNQLTKDIAKLDGQLGKAQGRGGQRGMGARRATQAAGAVISGGIFGGPEGALGALGGLAAGGVEGAFAGAAIGAVVGGGRQALGETAAYAAEINKLKIALQGVAPSQEDFNFAVQTAGRATRELNVPQEQSIRGITRLTAAVTGAGGPVEDAATTFRNVTAAIKATGGSSEDVQGAITAMVQVFSKGKVSAEELSGQLGERLPGAVTLFAKANKMTLPELQKNLKAGTVGLNELMNFIRELGDEFGGTAEKIASSNEEAGARLNVAFNEMRLGVGQALMGTGADLQTTFGNFIETTTPGVIKATELLVKAIKPVIKNLDLILVSIAGLASGAAIASVITNLAAIKTGLIGIKVAAAALLLNPIFAGAAAAAGIAAGIYLVTKAIRDQRSEIEKLQGADPNKAIAAYTNEERLVEIAKTKQQLSAARAQRQRLISAGEGEGGFDTTKIDAKIASAEARLARLTAPVKRKSAGGDFEYDPVSADGGGTGTGTKSTLARRVEQAQALESRMQRQLLLAQQQTQLGRLLAKQDNERSVLQEKIAKLTKGETNAELKRAVARAKDLQNQKLAAELQQKINDIAEKAAKPLEDALKAVKEKFATDKRYADLIKKGIAPERAKDIISIEKAKKETLKRLDVEIKILEAIVAQGGASKELIEALKKLKKEREEAEGVDGEKATEGGDYDKNKSDFKKFQETFEEGLKEMIDIGPQLANVALNAINSVTDGIVQLITTGKANFKEMAASILADLAKIMIRAAIVKAVAGAFGINLSANGNVIQAGRIKPYAQGGVVSGPTVFPMAGGEVGLMGEAGPEAIMPLKRGPSGRLGVEVTNQGSARDAMNRYSRRSTAVGGGGMTAEDEAIAAVQGSAVPIDVRYNVERINNVDYVTAEEFQAGMRQAASQGAQQGQQLTLTRLQQSPATRRRLGL